MARHPEGQAVPRAPKEDLHLLPRIHEVHGRGLELRGDRGGSMSEAGAGPSHSYLQRVVQLFLAIQKLYGPGCSITTPSCILGKLRQALDVQQVTQGHLEHCLLLLLLARSIFHKGDALHARACCVRPNVLEVWAVPTCRREAREDVHAFAGEELVQRHAHDLLVGESAGAARGGGAVAPRLRGGRHGLCELHLQVQLHPHLLLLRPLVVHSSTHGRSICRHALGLQGDELGQHGIHEVGDFVQQLVFVELFTENLGDARLHVLQLLFVQLCHLRAT
mmetsp:Transcript_77579/g.139986  ORF Transcript_77579/g.139986 Transcript_77579/m.139986 type:complete len:277 (-) Transcript_77579:945-1775(-)